MLVYRSVFIITVGKEIIYLTYMYSFCYCMNWLITMDTLKVSPPVFFYVGPHCKKWYGSRHWTFPPVLYYILLLWQMTAEWQSHRIAFDMEVCMKQRYVSKHLRWERIATTNIHQWLLNIYGDQAVDVSMVRWCLSAVTGTVGHYHKCRFSQHSIQAHIHCWRKGIANGGDYTEK